MAGEAPEGSQFDARQYDSKMELLSEEGKDFFTSDDEVYDTFDSTGLAEKLLEAIYAYGFEKPSAIQQRGIVPFCKGLGVIQQAQSGTGKTATFCSDDGEREVRKEKIEAEVDAEKEKNKRL